MIDGKWQILVVDDSQLNLKVLEKILTDEGMVFYGRKNAADTFQFLVETTPDLILLDINLPDINGLEICRQLKATLTYKDIPVIFISALDTSEDTVRGFEAGGVDYLTKPIAKAEVSVRVRNQLTIINLRRELEQRIHELEGLYKEVKEVSIRDPLTGLFNRRYLSETLLSNYFHARRYKNPLTVLMSDLDHFKTVNDTFGHAVGDEVLKRFAQIILRNLRNSDIPARYGGEEFFLILTGTEMQNGLIVAERIRQSVQDADWSDLHPDLKMTVSIGLAQADFEGQPDDPVAQLIERADQKLYQAKKAGRNQVCS